MVNELQIAELVVVGILCVLFALLSWRTLNLIQTVNDTHSRITREVLRDLIQHNSQLVDHIRSTDPEQTIWFHTQERSNRVAMDRKVDQSNKMAEVIAKSDPENEPKATDDFYNL